MAINLSGIRDNPHPFVLSRRVALWKISDWLGNRIPSQEYRQIAALNSWKIF